MNEKQVNQLKETEKFLTNLSLAPINNYQVVSKHTQSVKDAINLIDELQNKVNRLHACMTTLLDELHVNEKQLVESASKSNESDRENMFHTAYGIRLSKDAAKRIFEDADHSHSECGQAIELVHEVIAMIAQQAEDITYESVVKLLSDSIGQRKKIEEYLLKLNEADCFHTDNVGVMSILLDCMSEFP